MKTEFQDALKGFHRDYVDVETEEFAKGYKPIGTLPVVSLLLGLLSVFLIFGWGMLIIPLVALITGGVALRRIMASPSDLGGFRIALLGIVFALGWTGVGSCYLVWSYYNEVPVGYMPLAFHDLLANPRTGELPSEIVQLAEKNEAAETNPDVAKTRIFLEGYMYAGKHLNDLDQFVLVESNSRSRFQRPDRDPTESVLVKLVGGRTVSHRIGPVRVGGVLKINKERTGSESPYVLEADVFR